MARSTHLSSPFWTREIRRLENKTPLALARLPLKESETSAQRRIEFYVYGTC
jgi:hypothetical protein